MKGEKKLCVIGIEVKQRNQYINSMYTCRPFNCSLHNYVDHFLAVEIALTLGGPRAAESERVMLAKSKVYTKRTISQCRKPHQGRGVLGAAACTSVKSRCQCVSSSTAVH